MVKHPPAPHACQLRPTSSRETTSLFYSRLLLRRVRKHRFAIPVWRDLRNAERGNVAMDSIHGRSPKRRILQFQRQTRLALERCVSENLGNSIRFNREFLASETQRSLRSRVALASLVPDLRAIRRAAHTLQSHAGGRHHPSS